MFNQTIIKCVGVFVGLVAVLFLTQCAGKTATAKTLPQDILGISVGMNKADAQKRLEEIGQMTSEDRKAGQLWQLKSDPRFANLAVAYDKEQKIRFVTALVDKEKAQQRVRFAEIGDLTAAKAEIVAPHYRYVWETAATDRQPAQTIIIYGDNPDSITLFSLSKKIEAQIGTESEEEE